MRSSGWLWSRARLRSSSQLDERRTTHNQTDDEPSRTTTRGRARARRGRALELESLSPRALELKSSRNVTSRTNQTTKRTKRTSPRGLWLAGSASSGCALVALALRARHPEGSGSNLAFVKGFTSGPCERFHNRTSVRSRAACESRHKQGEQKSGPNDGSISGHFFLMSVLMPGKNPGTFQDFQTNRLTIISR